MKRLLSVFFALTCSLALATGVPAERGPDRAKPEDPSNPASVRASGHAGAAASAGREDARKGKLRRVTGTVEAVDAAAGTLTVKGRRGRVTLNARDGSQLVGLKAGDRVLVKYSGKTANRVDKVNLAGMKGTTRKGTVGKALRKKEGVTGTAPGSAATEYPRGEK